MDAPKIYLFDQATKLFIGVDYADPDPLETGKWLYPANATLEPLPDLADDEYPIFDVECQKWNKLKIFPDPEPTIEQLRANMQLSAADARIRLAKAGLLLRVIETINAMPDDSILKIKWEYETTFKRLDPTLVDFCNETLGMDNEQIDALFM